MLRTENESRMSAQGWSRSIRLATALGLVALTIGVAAFKAPARAGDEPTPAALRTEAKPKAPDSVAEPFAVGYVGEGMMGLIAVRPAEAARRLGMETPWIKELIGGDLSDLLGEFQGEGPKVDMNRPGFLRLGPESIESVIIGFNIYGAKGLAQGSEETRKMHRIELGEDGGVTVRTVAPFDWLAFLRQWKIDLQEVREPHGIYYKISAPAMARMGHHVGIYLPDDRTLVYEKEALIKGIIARGGPSDPTYLRGADWERVSRDLIAVVIDNRDDLLAKNYDLGRGDDKIVLSLLKGIDRWVLGLAARDSLMLHTEVTGREPESVESVANAIKTLVAFWLKALDDEPDAKAADERIARRSFRLYKSFLANLKLEQAGRSLTIASEGFGTMVDLGAILKADLEDDKARANAAPEAEAKKVKR